MTLFSIYFGNPRIYKNTKLFKVCKNLHEARTILARLQARGEKEAYIREEYEQPINTVSR